jgi:hypothetical protein
MMPGLKPLLPSRPVNGSLLGVVTSWLRHRLTRPRGSIRRAGALQRVISTALATFRNGELAGWRVYGRLDGRSGNVVVRVGPDAHSGGLLKISDSPWGRTELERQATILEALHADTRLGSWRQMVPRVMAAGPVCGAYCVLETMLPAGDGCLDLSDPDRRDRLETAAITAICELSRSTASHVAVTARETDRWVSEPMTRVRGVVGDADRRILREMEAVLSAQVAGRRVATGWVHGDFHPANILCDADGSIVGIVDWCAAQGDGMVVLDVVNLLLSTEMSARRQQLGTVVSLWLRQDGSPALLRLQSVQQSLDCDPIEARTLILLAWLRHVAQFIATEPPGVISPLWTHRNVRSVLRAWKATLEGNTQL